MWRLAIVTALATTGCVYRVTVEHETIEIDQAYDEIVLHNETGDVGVIASAAPGELEVTQEWHGTEPDVTWRVEDGRLSIEADCPRDFAHCSVDMTLYAPAEASGRLDVGTGDVRVRGLGGALEIEVGTGEIRLSDLAGDLDARTGTGDIDGQELSGSSMLADTGTGSIDLRIVDVFDVLDAETGTGDIDLYVPAGVYAVDAGTGTGTVDLLGVTDDAGAPSSIRARTGTGHVTIVGWQNG
jgi:DUF4097 and DUF4098 domain-containing protein YvlB